MEHAKRLIVIRPICELQGRTERMEDILGSVLEKLDREGVEIVLVEKVSELDTIRLGGQRVLFAICLSEAGVNMEYYRLLEGFRAHPNCLIGTIGGIIVDGNSELFTKALARRLAFSANRAGCTFPGKPLVEATGSLGNFHVLSGIRNVEPYEVYRQQVEALARKVLAFERPAPPEPSPRPKILAIHASSRKTSNSLLLWDKVRSNLESRAELREISLRNGDLVDCRGCRYEDCLHFGENGGCFYGGIMTEQVYPAILECDALVMICPNYNDAVSANLTAFINRLTAIFRVHDFGQKRIYAIVVSGYSGGDIVSEQIIGALNFNKAFILPGNFALVETANDPKSILDVPDIDDKARAFAERILSWENPSAPEDASAQGAPAIPLSEVPAEVLWIMETLEQHGHEAYLVGGCVRDLLLGRTPSDYDVTTSALPDETETIFREHAGTVSVGKAHGTIGVIVNRKLYEVTTYRIDGTYTDHRRPDSVAFTRLLAEDLKRRDFTVNALAADRFGRCPAELPIIRQGLSDLKAGIIRAVGDPVLRFSEDALRILRGIRFSAQLGFPIEEETGAAIHAGKAMLQEIAKERIRVEFSKMLCAGTPGTTSEGEPPVIRVLREYRDVIGEVFPELAEGFDFDQQNPFHCYDVYEHELHALKSVVIEDSKSTDGAECGAPDEVVRLAALFHDIGKPACFSVSDGWGHFYGHEQVSEEMARGALRRLRYDKQTVRDVAELIRVHGTVFNPTLKYARRKLNQYGEEMLLRLIRLERADVSAQAPSVRAERIEMIGRFEGCVREVIESRQCFSRKEMDLAGNDLKAIGIPEGPEIGRILGAIFEKVLNGDLPNEYEVLIREAERLGGEEPEK